MTMNLITDEVAQQVNAIHLMEAEVNRLSECLNNPGSLKCHLEYSGEEPKAYLRRLMERRVRLLEKLRSEREAAKSRVSNRGCPSALIPFGLGKGAKKDILELVSTVLSPWLQLIAPIMTEGISQTPGVQGTHGQIQTTALYLGGAAYSGTLEDDGTHDPRTEKFWIHNWNSFITFTAPSERVKLTYNFGVSSEAHIYLAPVLSGSVMAFVTVGTTNDISRPIVNWQTVGWPINITLPRSGILSFSGDVPVSGDILLEAGQSGALGLTLGVIVSVASGYVQFLWGNFGTHLANRFDANAYGLIEVRFDPLAVVNSALPLIDSMRMGVGKVTETR